MNEDLRFVFDGELRIGDPQFEVLEGHVCIADGVLRKYPFFNFYAEEDAFRFYADYNVKTDDVKVVTTYYPEGNQKEMVLELPLIDEDKAELIAVMKDYCKEKYKVDCLGLVNWQREAAKLETLERPAMRLVQQICEAEDAVRTAEKAGREVASISLWGRLGVDIRMTPEEFAILKKGDREAEDLLVALIRSDRCRLNGETYFPEAPNYEHISVDLEFDLNPQALHKDAFEREQR